MTAGPDRGVLVDSPGTMALEEIELDGPGPGEVQVRLTASGVCHTDLHILETGGWGAKPPVLLGHEGAGIVEVVGEGVDKPAVGETVVLGWRSPCGRCPACERGAPRFCRTPLRARRRLRRASDDERLSQALLCGTFSTRTIVHAGAAVPVPAELPPEQACLLGCAVATGVGATAGVWPGASVAVIGCGAVGLSVVQGAKLAGAARIVAIDLDPRKVEQAYAFGATDADASEPVDFAFDVVGRPETLEQAVRLLEHGGTATLMGVPHGGQRASLDLATDLWNRRATVRVSHGGDHLPAEDIPRLARLALNGRLDLAGMVSRTLTLDEVEDAFEAMRRGDVIRSVIQL